MPCMCVKEVVNVCVDDVGKGSCKRVCVCVCVCVCG